MILDAETSGRRAALRARHHRAILDAAAELIRETDGTAFSVDDLARRADVSRRTVFNHFDSLDDVVSHVFGDLLGAILDDLETRPSPGGEDLSMFDELAHMLTSTDLFTPMAYITRVLGGPDAPGELTPRRAAMLGRAFTEVSGRLSAEMLRRHPEAEPLDVQLLVGSLMSGVITLHTHWCSATGGADDATARQLWSDLVEHLVRAARTGYGAAPATSAAL